MREGQRKKRLHNFVGDDVRSLILLRQKDQRLLTGVLPKSSLRFGARLSESQQRRIGEKHGIFSMAHRKTTCCGSQTRAPAFGQHARHVVSYKLFTFQKLSPSRLCRAKRDRPGWKSTPRSWRESIPANVSCRCHRESTAWYPWAAWVFEFWFR
jgi:hypothetical protein